MNGTCRKIGHSLQDFLQENLAEADSRRVREHLAGCERCSAELETLQEMQDLGAALGPRVESTLPVLRQRILSRIQDSDGAVGGVLIPVWAGRAVIAAAVAVILSLPLVFDVVDFSLERPESSPVPGKTPAFTITFEQDRLVITWPENGDRIHRIARSTSPIDFTNAEIREFRGSRWVDDEQQPVGTVYFYRVD